MNERQLKKSYLESLPTDELNALAEELGLDLPPDLNRIFVIQEILEASQQDDETSEDIEDVSSVKVEKPPFFYNKTYIEVLLRDPVWAFVFWEIKTADRELHEATPGFNGYQLRVVALHPGKNPDDESFSIDVDMMDRAWYVCFPSSEGWFKVELRMKKAKDFILLAETPPFKIPESINMLRSTIDTNPLAPILLLSGLDELEIIHSGDFQSHILQQCDF
ncbi:DUF4912 domain-containing protein [Gracilinema caldarium]|uniref:DUF4912 domain-containing protein n=1 Tax=Gracilinema caldarium (strain ATCC 51460 / DSM 7334 / H1) TaxID=744872 RepID=F8EXH1_GRAC1|nr:DUF4912 domain-containing protein [Gracilinema caldarium]AEJ19198.1 hypothetical protein Spica_1049 [Gracilinema caldarium DSM 7334]